MRESERQKQQEGGKKSKTGGVGVQDLSTDDDDDDDVLVVHAKQSPSKAGEAATSSKAGRAGTSRKAGQAGNSTGAIKRALKKKGLLRVQELFPTLKECRTALEERGQTIKPRSQLPALQKQLEEVCAKDPAWTAALSVSSTA